MAKDQQSAGMGEHEEATPAELRAYAEYRSRLAERDPDGADMGPASTLEEWVSMYRKRVESGSVSVRMLAESEGGDVDRSDPDAPCLCGDRPWVRCGGVWGCEL